MKIIKWLLIALVVIVLLVAALVTVVVISIDSLAKSGVEKGATYALGVNTTLDSADLTILSPGFTMAGLTVANPDGFSAPHFMTLANAGFKLDAGSIQSEIIEIPEFSLKDIDIHLQRANGSSNFKTITDNLKKLEGEEDPSPEPAGEPQKFIIRNLSIDNVVVHADLIPIGGDATKVDVVIPSILLENVGEQDGGVTMAALTKIIVQSIMATIAANGGGILPADLLGDLQGQLSGLTNLSALGIDLSGDLGNLAGDATKAAQDALDGAVEDLGNQVDDAAKDLEEKGKDLLNNLPGIGGG